MRHILIILFLLFLTCPSAVYSAQKRVALVIGNGDYRNSPLQNPVNDARLMRNLLRKAGFSVTIVENARKNEMVNAINSFGRRLRNSDAALFYYSGHGNQYKGLNWLIPIGAKIQRESDIEFEGLNAERVLAEMEGGSSGRVNIVIFDACRVNRTFRSFRSYNSGLAYPKVQPEGSIVAYSTAPGTIAYDGDGRNSPYVSELKKYLLTPGLKIEDVFKRVRVGVKNRTARKPSPQIPWENSALMGDFYFVMSGEEQTSQTSYSKINADQKMWELIEFSKDPSEFKSFLESFPNSQFVPIARLKLKRLKTKENDTNGSTYNDDQVQRVVDFEYGKGIYTGEMLNGELHGQGKLTTPDGIRIEGEWKNGELHGHGTFLIKKTGEKHVGFWKDTIPNGQGTRTYPSGAKYIGEWKNGELHGHGTFLIKKTGEKYVGEWKDGKKNGQGTYTSYNGDKYVGEYKDGKRNGQGTYSWYDGGKYVGRWKDDKRNGQGTRTYEDGTYYKGEYMNGSSHGLGEVYFGRGHGKNYGDRYVGRFKDGKEHGYGKYYHADGSISIGSWKNGKVDSSTVYDRNGKVKGYYRNGYFSKY